MPGLSLAILGPYSAALAGRPLGRFRTRLAQALLIYLACEPERHRREHLMALLWPGLPQVSAQQNLRQNLYLLRRSVAEVAAQDGRAVPFVLADSDIVQLNPDAVVAVDARRFAALIDRLRPGLGELEEAVALYRGDFLADFYLADSNPFEEWAAARREAYRRGVLSALERLTAIHLSDEDFAAAENCARRQLAIDPLHETGHRQLIEILARDGRRSAALAHFDDYRRLLYVELGVKPGSETLALIDAVQAGELLPAARRPDHIRGYDIHEELGRGSYGVVFRASQPAIGRDVAIKVIPARYADDVAFIRRFEAEAQTIARLEHPQVVPLYDYWREPGSAYLVMRYLRGGNLKAALPPKGWPIDRVSRLLEQLAAALGAAHRQGIVHRDVKPANVLLDEDGNAYLTDFGIARLLQSDSTGTTGIEFFAGTPEYVSPEMVLNGAVTPLSDQYSLGLVVYEALAGRPPFVAGSLLELLEKHAREPLPSLHEARPDLSAAMEEVLGQATAKRPADRYPDIVAFAEAFRAARGGKAASTPGERLLRIDNPYKGLLPFTEADEALFYGREALTQKLVDRLAEGGDQGRFLAVVGPSGSGKSSLARAGLVPALRQGALPGSEAWLVLDMIPGAHPYEELETALLRVAVNPPASLLEQLQDGERGLLRAVRRVLPTNDSQLLLIIDQFEELFTLVADREVTARFLDSLVAAVTDPRSPLRLVVTLRADFYDRPLLHPGLSELMQARTEVVVPLSTDELVRAIERPAERVGVEVEPELVAALVADVNEQPGALPLLQYTLSELFEGREDGRLTLDAYRALGGISGALAGRAEAVYEGLDEAGQTAARALFSRLVTLGEGVEDTRRRVLRDELMALGITNYEFRMTNEETAIGNGHSMTGGSELVTPLDAYGRARLLSFDRDPVTRGPTVEIAHEALLRAWPRLRGWLDEDRAALRLSRLLTAAAAEWAAAGQDEGFLLRGARLDQLAPLAGGTVALTEGERRFLETSLAAREARRAAEEARRQAEIDTAQKLAETERRRADEQAQSAGRLRQRAALLAGALGLAIILAVVAFSFARSSARNADVAATREAEALANAELASTRGAEAAANAELAVARRAEAETAAELAVTRQAEAEAEAVARATAESEAVQERELATSRELSLASLNVLETDPELSMLLALQGLETARTMEAQDALHRAIQTSRTRLVVETPADRLALSPDGERLATIEAGAAIIWDAGSGARLHSLALSEEDSADRYALAFDESGRRLAALTGPESDDHVTLHIWNLDGDGPATTQTLPILLDFYSSVTLSPDWSLVAVGFENGTAELWDVATAERVSTLGGHNDWAWDVRFNPDGRLLLTASPDGQVRVWDVAESVSAGSGRQAASLQVGGARAALNTAKFIDDTTLALAFQDYAIEVWDLADSSRPLFTLLGHTNNTRDFAVNSERTLLASVAQDGTARVWDLATGEALLTLARHFGSVNTLAFYPDGERLATIGNSGQMRVWDTRPQALGEQSSLFVEPFMFDVKLSPDGRQVALGSITGPARLLDLDIGEVALTLPDTEGGVYRVAYSPDGTRLAGVGADNVIRIWDAVTGETILAWTGHGEGVSGGFYEGTLDVAYSPDGTRIATAGADGMAKVWDAATGEELLTLAGHSDGLHSIAYSPDGRLIATSSDEQDTTVKVWEAQTGVEIYSLSGHTARAWGLAFSPDASRLVTSGFGGIVKVWDMGTGEELYTLPNQSTSVLDVAFTPDGQHFITTGGSGTRVWRKEDGELVMTLDGGGSVVAAISRDGRWLYTTSLDGMVRVFALQLEDTVALAYERLFRWWRPEECLAYLHTEECPAAPEKFAVEN